MAFISDLIDKLAAEHNVDPARIFVNGLSQGGGMSFALSCELPERVAAVGLVAAAHFLPFEWCGDRRPKPMIRFSGAARAMRIMLVPLTAGPVRRSPLSSGGPRSRSTGRHQETP